MTTELLFSLFFCGGLALFIAGHVTRKVSLLGACSLFNVVNFFAPIIWLSDLDFASKTTIGFVNLAMLFINVLQIYNVVYYSSVNMKKEVEV